MGKEVKIGLSVVAGLLLIFGGVLYWRINYTKPRAVVDAELMKSDAASEAAADGAGSAAPDSTVDGTASEGGWSRPNAQSAGDYRKAAQLDAEDGEASLYAKSAQHTTGADDGSSSASDTGAADPFQQRGAHSSISATEAETTDESTPGQLEEADGARSLAVDTTEEQAPVDSSHDAQSVVTAAAQETTVPGRSIVKSAAATGPAARANQQVAEEVDTAPAPQSRRSYLDDEVSQAVADGKDAYQTETEPAAGAGVSSQVEVVDGRYTVQPNDNYWVISEKLYGNAGYFKALQAFNRSRSPQHAEGLAVGDLISAPSADELMKAFPNLCPKPRKLPPQHLAKQASSHRPLGAKVYVVEEGDTLFDVARYELGKASRWAEIYDLNREVLGEDFDYLKPGTELVMPTERRSEDRITRQPAGRKLR